MQGLWTAPITLTTIRGMPHSSQLCHHKSIFKNELRLINFGRDGDERRIIQLILLLQQRHQQLWLTKLQRGNISFTTVQDWHSACHQLSLLDVQLIWHRAFACSYTISHDAANNCWIYCISLPSGQLVMNQQSMLSENSFGEMPLMAFDTCTVTHRYRNTHLRRGIYYIPSYLLRELLLPEGAWHRALGVRKESCYLSFLTT
jgi:hypothetical protein